MNQKPIVIIRYNPSRFEYQSDPFFKMNKLFEEKFTDYHTFCYPDNTVDNFEFKIFKTDKFSRIQYKKLTDLIKSSLAKLNEDKK